MDKTSIKELFLQAVERDNPEPYFTDWALQFSQETREKTVFGLDFKDYKEGDLKKWMDMCSEFEFPCYLPKELTEPLIERAYEKDKQFGIPYEKYRKTIGQENAIDYIFPNIFKKDIDMVLDFGAGYGRQANLNSDGIYVGMDGVLNSYCCQNEYYNLLGLNHWDYTNIPTGSFAYANKKMHIPTWRYDLLPDDYFDLVICVQVLPELSEQLLTKMLTEFHRILKTGGIIYIRDHNEKWQPCNKVNVHQFLIDLGFEKGKTDDKNWKEVEDGKDLHGVPRVYFKRN